MIFYFVQIYVNGVMPNLSTNLVEKESVLKNDQMRKIESGAESYQRVKELALMKKNFKSEPIYSEMFLEMFEFAYIILLLYIFRSRVWPEHFQSTLVVGLIGDEIYDIGFVNQGSLQLENQAVMQARIDQLLQFTLIFGNN